MEVPLFRINVKQLVPPALRELIKSDSDAFKAIRTIMDFIKDDSDKALGARDYFTQKFQQDPVTGPSQVPAFSRPSLSLGELFEVRTFQNDHTASAVKKIESLIESHPELRSDFFHLFSAISEVEQSKNERNKTGTIGRARRHSMGILSSGKDLDPDIKPRRRRDDETISFETMNPNAGEGIMFSVGKPPEQNTSLIEDPELEVSVSENAELSLEDAIGLYLSEDEQD